MPSTRQHISQKPPDGSLPWKRFPRLRLKKERKLYRAAKKGYGAWWFCKCKDCRFDLSCPHGTCYMGMDPVSGVMETIGPDLCGGMPPFVLIPKFAKERVIHVRELDKEQYVADLCNRQAASFKVTNELANMTPYREPQAYARLFHQITGPRNRRMFHGIRYRSRYDTGAAPRAIALFGDEEEGDWTSEIIPIDERLISELRKIFVAVEERPELDAIYPPKKRPNRQITAPNTADSGPDRPRRTDRPIRRRGLRSEQ